MPKSNEWASGRIGESPNLPVSDSPFPVCTSPCPPRRHFRASRGVLVIAGIRCAFIENHRDVAAEGCLNFHRDFRRDKGRRPIYVILKMQAFVRDLPQLRERKNLISAAIGQDRAIPSHEPVKAAKMFDHIESGPDEQMIGISENDLRTEFA